MEKGIGNTATSEGLSEMEDSQNSSDSENLSPPLPDDNSEPVSHTSTISEHLDVSLEHDRSCQEIEVSHIPSNFSLILKNNNDELGISQEHISLNSLTSSDTVRNVQNIIDEILNTEKFHSDSETTVSLDIFGGINLDDSSINNYVSRLRNNSMEYSGDMNSLNERNSKPFNSATFSDKSDHIKEYTDSKDAVMANLEQEMASNQSTSLNTNSTEYKNALEEYQNKIIEFQTSVSQRDDIIKKLEDCLYTSVISREKLQKEQFETALELNNLREELSQVTDKITSEGVCQKCENSVQNIAKFAQSKNIDLENECSVLEDVLTNAQVEVLKDLKVKINFYIQEKIGENKFKQDNEIKILKDKFESEKSESDAEISRLRSLLSDIRCGSTELVVFKQELDIKHKKEMEELRIYYEQKCTDIEKNYSEDIFSQQSRKLSKSSSGGSFDNDMPSDVIAFGNRPIVGPGGDTVANLTANLQAVSLNELNLQRGDFELLRNELKAVNSILASYNDITNVNMEEFENLKMELGNCNVETLFKASLTGFKDQMEQKYKMNLVNFEKKFKKESNEHQKIVDSLVIDYEEKLSNMRLEASRNVSSAIQEVASSGEYELAEVVESYERRLQEQVALAKLDVISAVVQQIQMLVSDPIDENDWPDELLQLKECFTEKYEAEIASINAQHEDEISKLKDEHNRTLNSALERARRRSLRDGDSLTQADIQIIKERDNYKKTTQTLQNLLGELLKYFTRCEDELNITLVDEIVKNCQIPEIDFDETTASSGTTSELTSKRVHLAPDFTDLMQLLDSSTVSSIDSRELSLDLDTCLQRLRQDANNLLVITNNFKNNKAVNSNLNRGLEETGSNLINKAVKEGLNRELCCDREHRVVADVALLETAGDLNKMNAGDSNLTALNVSQLAGDQMTPNLNLAAGNSNVSTQISSLEEKISSLTRQLINESQLKRDLSSELMESRQLVQGLESERVHLENTNQHILDKQKVLEHNLNIAREKISDLVECGRREIVSEGFGLQPSPSDSSTVYTERLATLHELQERAKRLAGGSEVINSTQMLQLMDEMVLVGERFGEEARREYEDVRQQMEVADKKLRATSHFLEEQAMERESEREESQKAILELQEQFKERDKDRVNFERITIEVEQLECQMQTMSQIIEANELRFNDVNIEKQEAIEKVRMLRDIIRNLEGQVDTKTASETELKELVNQLEILVKKHQVVNDELKNQLEENDGLNREYVDNLEAQLKKLRLSSDFAENEGALKQIQLQLHDFELSLDRRIKDLDSFHTAISTCCSSPSEDMSIRDQIRPHTPNSTLDDCDVPLQQLARLKEKLVRHARAEEAAVKRIRDLEMQTIGHRQELEEVQNERDLLQDQISEQLVLISSLQMRLDEQRMRAEHIQKATNTSLEVRIYDLETEIQHLQDVINARDKTIRQINKNFEETKQKLNNREKELGSINEDVAVANLQKVIDDLKLENALLQTRISNDVQNSKMLPNIVDNILADKNSDIEKLRDQLNDTQLRLNSFLSLNLDTEQIKNLSALKSTDRAFSDFLSLTNIDNTDQLRRAETKHDSLNQTNLGFNRKANETTLFGSKSLNFEPDFSTIDAATSNLTLEASLKKPNSTEIHQRSAEKKVHFEEPHVVKLRQENDDLKGKLLDLEQEMVDKEVKLEEFALKIQQIDEAERKINDLQKSFEQTEENLKKVTETLQEEKNVAEETQKNLRIELAEKKMHLDERVKELELLKQDCLRKDNMYLNLAKEKKDLDARNLELQKASEMYQNVGEIIIDKNKEIYLLEEKLAMLGEVTEKLEQLDNTLSERETELADTKENYLSVKDELDEKTAQYKEIKDKYQRICNDFKEKDKLNEKFEKELKNKTSQITQLTEQLKKAAENYRLQLDGKMNEIEAQTNEDRKDLESKIKDLQNIVVDRECELDILKEDVTTYQNDIAKLEAQLKSGRTDDYDLKMMRNRKELAQKDLDIVKLKTTIDDLRKELLHLQDYLKEKDIIIEQMKTDSKTLQINLETIQTKMQEDGNIVDLRTRLQDEQRFNLGLQDEMNHLKTILAAKNENVMTKSIEEITGQVRKQLDYSAHLDSSILNALNSGENIDELKELLKKEKMTNKELTSTRRLLESESNELERKFEALKASFAKLQQLLDTEKKNCAEIQVEDSNLIEQMRIRLEAALETETEYEAMLKREKTERSKLENELVSLKSKFSSSDSNSRTEDITEYKSLPNLNHFELNKLRDDLNLVKEENETLKAEIRNFKKDKYEVASKVKYLTDLIDMKKEEIVKLEQRLQRTREDEDGTKEKWLLCKVELEQRNRELDNSRILMGEMEEEIRDYKKDVQSLNDKISEMEEQHKMKELERLEKDRNADLTSTVPEKFVKKMKDLSKLVKEHVSENKVLAKTLQNMNEDRNNLLAKIRALEGQNVKMPFDDPVARANHLFGRYLRSESFRKSLVWQKRYLIALLATYQSAKPVNAGIISTEHLDKINLKPVKRKLIGKARFRCVALSVTAIIRMRYLVLRWHSGRRFTPNLPFSQHTYQRYITTNSNNNNNTSTTSQAHAQSQQVYSAPPTRFHVGEPVVNPTPIAAGSRHRGGGGGSRTSGGGVSATSGGGVSGTLGASRRLNEGRGALGEVGQRSVTPTEGGGGGDGHRACPWSGRTPPSKDGSGGGSRGNSIDNVVASTSGISDNLLPLETPDLLTQYVDRFNTIQQKLGLNS